MISDNLRQINATYLPKQDRLLVKLSNSNDQQYRIWFTRRFTRLLMGVLDSNFLAESQVQGAITKEAQKAFADYQHIQNVKEDCFSDEYQDETTSSAETASTDERVFNGLTEQPHLLAHTINYQSREDGGLTLSIIADEQKTLTLNMDFSMKHQFYELLERSLDLSDWFGGDNKEGQDLLVTKATH